MKNLPNIEKSGFKDRRYVGYSASGRVWRITGKTGKKIMQLNNQSVVYFIWGEVDHGDGAELDLIEVAEREFLNAKSVTSYERHTTFENGVNLICRTKTEGT